MKIFEIYRSIQGEGIYTGIPTVFIRTTGCNLKCKWCDTPYAADPLSGKDMTLPEILEKVDGFNTKYVCLTGGEPLNQREDTMVLSSMLVEEGHKVVLETNGSHPVEVFSKMDDVFISLDCKTPSSGMSKMMLFKNYGVLRSGDQLKFIVMDENDWTYSIQMLDRIIKEYGDWSYEVIFQPAWGSDPKWLAGKVTSCGYDHVRFMLQTHKYIWGPSARGV